MYPTECLGDPKANAVVLTWGRFSEAQWLHVHDRSSKTPLVGWGESCPATISDSDARNTPVCHVRIMETAVIPEQYEAQVQVQLLKAALN